VSEGYLGDGIYASHNGYYLRLATPRAVREDDGIDVIYLDPEVLASLLAYLKKKELT
jgi:hypothetical protein